MNRYARLAATGLLTVAAITWGDRSSFAAAPSHAPDHGHPDTSAKPHTPASLPPPDAGPEGVAPDAALKMLVDGNRRFVDAVPQDLRRDDTRRCETATGGQHPFAAVLSCADSRVPAELVFDQGIGDLFVVRVAGNVADTDEIGTIEYGVDHLGTRLVVVLGHTKCGAVTAVVNSGDSHGSPSGDAHAAPISPNLAGLLDNIAPAAEKARKANPRLKGNALVVSAIRLNVMRSIEDLLAHSDALRAAAKSGTIKLVGGVYDIHSGSIDWLGAHPDEVNLLGAPVAGKSSKPKVSGKPAELMHGKEHKTLDKTSAKDAHSGAPHGASSSAEHGRSPATSLPKSSHNILALGGCLAGGAGVSAVAMHFLNASRKAHA